MEWEWKRVEPINYYTFIDLKKKKLIYFETIDSYYHV